MSRSALKAIVVGASSFACFGYINHLSADEKSKFSFFNVKKDTISPIPDSPYKGSKNEDQYISMLQTTRSARDLVQQTMAKNGYPGLVVGVSIKGTPCWVQGFGFSNIETATRCTKNTVMRIASISKPITMAAVAKLYEEGKIDLDKNIYEYLGDQFSVKEIDGEKVAITIRQLASHQGGIRHYLDSEEVFDTRLLEKYPSAVKALESYAFKDDLVAKPGTKFVYSTFGYTLIAAAVEMAEPSIKSFGQYLVNMCRHDLGMNNTYLDDNESIILNRAKQYTNESSGIKNANHVEASYKLSGGGLLSTVPDLLTFGNSMMYSYLPHLSEYQGFLKKSTVDMLWTPVAYKNVKISPCLFDSAQYGLGWSLVQDSKAHCTAGNCPPFNDIIYHTGAATGGTTFLIIVPEKEMVVALLCNLHKAKDLIQLGRSVAELFANANFPTNITVSPKEIVAVE